MKNVINLTIAVLLLGATAMTQMSCSELDKTRAYETEQANTYQTGNTVATSPDPEMEGWSDASKLAVMMMKKKYGEPTAATSEMMMWENAGQWKKTVIYAKEHQHDFPLPHTDVMQQWINYEVPPAKFDELANFDGSVVVNRTNGVISARYDLEGANFLAINLAHDIIEGDKDVKGARDFYTKTIKEMIGGEKPAYMQKLQFDVPSGNTAFTDKPDTTISKDEMAKLKQMKEKMKQELLTSNEG